MRYYVPLPGAEGCEKLPQACDPARERPRVAAAFLIPLLKSGLARTSRWPSHFPVGQQSPPRTKMLGRVKMDELPQVYVPDRFPSFRGQWSYSSRSPAKKGGSFSGGPVAGTPCC